MAATFVSLTVCPAKLDNYLLEKSRVAVRNEAEQNYHIFYQMFAGLSSDGRLGQMDLNNPSDHHYLQVPLQATLLRKLTPFCLRVLAPHQMLKS